MSICVQLKVNSYRDQNRGEAKNIDDNAKREQLREDKTNMIKVEQQPETC